MEVEAEYFTSIWLNNRWSHNWEIPRYTLYLNLSPSFTEKELTALDIILTGWVDDYGGVFEES